MSERSPNDPSEMNYTLDAKKVAELQRLMNDNKGRHLIGRDTNILEGMYGGSYGGETIVVDYNKEAGRYDYLVYVVKERSMIVDETGTKKVDKQQILNNVFELVRERLNYSKDAVNAIFRDTGSKEHQKIGLSVYINEGVGVCRHQALLAAALLELIAKEGIISGSASVDRSIQWAEEGDPGGHAWVRYTNSVGEVFILDPAQNFIGSLEEAQSRDHGWNYLRPDEKPPASHTRN